MTGARATPASEFWRRRIRSARAGLVLAVACLCQLMVVLDISVVNVALPSIRADLGFDADSLQWVINAYTLTFGGLLLLGGRIADSFGHRRAALIGLLLFGVTSLLGGLARNSGELVAARAAQGVAGALLLPMSLTLITTTFPEGAARNRALAIWGAVAGAGGALGVFLGGLLTEELDWRWVLFINVPIAAVGIALVQLSVPHRRSVRPPRMDIVGATLVTLAMFSLVYAVVRTNQHAWGSVQTIASLGVAAVLGAAFVLVEQRLAVAPIVRFGILRNRSLLAANIVVLSISSAQFGAFYFASIYLQGILGFNPLETGLSFVPFSLGIIVGTVIAGRAIPRFGVRFPLTAGLIVAAAGLGWFAWVSPYGSFVGDVLGPSLPTSLGLGACFVSVASAATSGVAPDEAGLASGLLNSSRQCGGSIGLAVLVTVANTIAHHRGASGSTPSVALTAGFARGFLVAAIITACGAAVAAALLGPDRRNSGDSAEVESASSR